MGGPTRWDKGAAGLRTYENIAFDYEGDHSGVLISRLPGYLRNKPRIQHLMRALGLGVQVAEDVVWGALEGMILPSAVGDVLNRWGALVGEPRGSLISDGDYRPIIQARIRANLCPGDVDSIIGVLTTACAPHVCVEHVELQPGPAAYRIQIIREDFMSEPRRLRVRRIMVDVTPGGRDARYVEAVVGGFGPPGSCGNFTFNGPMSREI